MKTDLFEEYAGDYDRWFDENREVYLAELARIRGLLSPGDGRSIEIGAGSGRFAGPLGITYGIDPSYALCRMSHRRGIETIRGRAEEIPVKDHSFSSALLITVICFLDDPCRALREINRILIPGGFLIVAFLERGGEVHRKYIGEGCKGKFLSRAVFYTSGEVRAFMEDAGFLVSEREWRAGFCVIRAQKPA
ncbi:MAG: class I SAM-dependent methyltransferase [Methanomicrobiaceae archaeon]|nr:class I SAM-dependent methyltransferase [Methanomicrobiaceae archaeon]